MVGRGPLQIEICTPKKRSPELPIRSVSSLAGLSPPHTPLDPSPARNAASVPVEKPGNNPGEPHGGPPPALSGKRNGRADSACPLHPHRAERTPPNYREFPKEYRRRRRVCAFAPFGLVVRRGAGTSLGAGDTLSRGTREASGAAKRQYLQARAPGCSTRGETRLAPVTPVTTR